MTRWIVIALLTVTTGADRAWARPGPPPAQRAFYEQVFKDFIDKKAAAISATFDTFVTLDLAGKRKRYRKAQAANVLRTHLRGITPIRKSSKIVKRTTGYMVFRVHFYDASGRLRQANVHVSVKASGGSYLITQISR